MVIEDVRPTDGDAGHLGDALRDLLVHACRLNGFGRDQRVGIDTRSVRTFCGSVKPGSTLPHRLESADHQAGGDKQHDRQRDFDDHQRVSRAVPGLAGAR